MQKELHFLRKKDIFVIESLERLGRNYDEFFYIVQQLD
ncbi:resolvase [Enterococcus faecium]|nr:resolvase [Enterococcus faecium]MBX8958159.1 resolvase [Enterococcus faecium]RXE92647.1 resolvase [Enterococcus faecium]